MFNPAGNDSPVVYIVVTEKGWLTYNDETLEVDYVSSPENAAIYSKDGALVVARRYNGQACSYNMDTRKWRRVNK